MSAPTVWALAIDNNGGTGISVHATRALAMASLIRYCEEFIEGFTLEDVPDDQQQDSITEQMDRWNEWFVLQECTVEQEPES
jgi:hypothetical protein